MQDQETNRVYPIQENRIEVMDYIMDEELPFESVYRLIRLLKS